MSCRCQTRNFLNTKGRHLKLEHSGGSAASAGPADHLTGPLYTPASSELPADSFDWNHWTSNQVGDPSSSIMTGFHSSGESQMTHPPSQGTESPTGFVSSSHGSQVTPSPQPGAVSPTGSEHESVYGPPPSPDASTNSDGQSVSAGNQLNAGDLQAALNRLNKGKAPVVQEEQPEKSH